MSITAPCSSKCIFCFYLTRCLQRGPKETLYFRTTTRACPFCRQLPSLKDLEANMKERDIERIIRMQLAPQHLPVSDNDHQPGAAFVEYYNHFAGETL